MKPQVTVHNISSQKCLLCKMIVGLFILHVHKIVLGYISIISRWLFLRRTYPAGTGYLLRRYSPQGNHFITTDNRFHREGERKREKAASMDEYSVNFGNQETRRLGGGHWERERAREGGSEGGREIKRRREKRQRERDREGETEEGKEKEKGERERGREIERVRDGSA